MIPTLKLYDTYRRKIAKFIPISKQMVTLYACGPTVYDFAHLGNLRNYLFVDVLRRVLELNGYRLKHVMNITDVGHLTSDADSGEDKVQKGARKHGQSAWQIAKFFEAAFLEDLRILSILQPSSLCRATEHIAEQIEYIEDLEKKGFTYQTLDGVYFDTQKLASYGKIAKLDIAGLQGGKRVELGEKRQITDFALWKFSETDQPAIAVKQERQMQWSSPWGMGFPGWHIECSAMSEKYLGTKFDIHVGGEDHIPVHHANEIAQCEGRHGHQPANFWMHGYFLQMGKEKLSKSGKSLLLRDLLEQGYDPLAFRYLVLTGHYRSSMQFSMQALQSAAIALQRLRKMVARWLVETGNAAGDLQKTAGHAQANAADKGLINLEYQLEFLNCVNNDLNMPQALAVLWAVVKSKLSAADKRATVLYFDQVFALSLHKPANTIQIPSEITALAEQRLQARLNRRWADSDEIREKICQLGYVIKDTDSGYQLQASH